MGTKGNIGWGISNYFKLPNRKRKLLTKEFLQTFKEEIIKRDIEYNKKHNRSQLNYENETYYSFYGQIEGTGLFYEALKNACERHNLVKAIYKYTLKMPWYDSDCFEEDLVLEMVKKGVIEKGKKEDSALDFCEAGYMKAKYKLIQHHKGYNEIKYGNWFDDDKKGLEAIYKDSDWELIWLN
ncbi:TPA: hypothetical protein ACXDAY_002204 [Clostridium botulinum]|uniref:hypothetical protein n=1 Tax=Clostridium botulinum TaxID=1491 RepID=UPI0007747FF1|nr:hypothetical protein [Clostridium botulinum]AUN01515.1 hypothetical protein RSJ19_00600 [Clostridium botulinum]MBN3352093.1 hypothetical protein [Clostridium botulinum]MBN3359231.1 hypothetical protein [Clostridium botulinum]MBN3367054.1 hypothetical protein [Clostridium botulinum]MBN3371690.1 hypothetical protein [Clostridium botulinum]